MKKILFFTLFLFACGGSGLIQPEGPFSKSRETSGETPDWLKNGQRLVDKNGKKLIYFLGFGESKNKMSAKSSAELNGITSLASTYKTVSLQQGEAKSIETKSINVSGLIPSGRWWQEVFYPKIENNELVGWSDIRYEYYLLYSLEYKVYEQRIKTLIEKEKEEIKLTDDQEKIFKQITDKLESLQALNMPEDLNKIEVQSGIKVIDTQTDEPYWLRNMGEPDQMDNSGAYYFTGRGASKFKDTAADLAELEARILAYIGIKEMAQESLLTLAKSSDAYLKDFMLKTAKTMDHLFEGTVFGLVNSNIWWMNVDKTNWKTPVYEVFKRFRLTNEFYQETRNLLIRKAINRMSLNEKEEVGSFHNTFTTLMFAAKNNMLRLAERSILKGESINAKNQDGYTALFYAIEKDSSEIANLLLEKGADLTIKDKEGNDALLFAIKKKAFDLALTLINKGVLLNTKDADGNNALLLAIQNQKPELINLLIEKGVDVNVYDKDGNSPLMLALQKNNFMQAKSLIDKGADVNKKDKEGNTLLMNALKNKQFQQVKLLAVNGAHLNLKYMDGTPLILMAMEMAPEIVSLFIEKGVDVNTVDNDGNTLIFIALAKNYLLTVKLLIEKKADLTRKDKNGNTLLMLAIKTGASELSKFLIEQGADVKEVYPDGSNLLLEAVKQNMLEIAKVLIEKRVDLNSKDKNGVTTLLYCIKNNASELAKFLIENNADLKAKDNEGNTTLSLAFKNNAGELAKLIIEKGFDLNSKDKDGNTPLWTAYNLNYLELLKLMITKPADLNAKNKEGDSLLIKSIKDNKIEIALLLVEQGANVNEKDKRKKSVLRLAKEKRNKALLDKLKEKGAK